MDGQYPGDGGGFGHPSGTGGYYGSNPGSGPYYGSDEYYSQYSSGGGTSSSGGQGGYIPRSNPGYVPDPAYVPDPGSIPGAYNYGSGSGPAAYYGDQGSSNPGPGPVYGAAAYPYGSGSGPGAYGAQGSYDAGQVAQNNAPQRRNTDTTVRSTSSTASTLAGGAVRNLTRVMTYDHAAETARVKQAAPKRYQWQVQIYNLRWRDIEAWLQVEWPKMDFKVQRNHDWFIFEVPRRQTDEDNAAIKKLEKKEKRHRHRDRSPE